MKLFDFTTVWQTTDTYPVLKWELNQAPEIHSEDYLTLYIGDTFDANAYATVTDDFDRDLPLQILKNNVDTTRAGHYIVLYQAVDSFDKVTLKRMTVEVKEKPTPIIEANDIVLMVGEFFDPLQGVLAYDELNPSLTVEILQNTVDTSTPGIYTVTYRVVNSLGVETLKTISVTVEALPDTKPENKPDEGISTPEFKPDPEAGEAPDENEFLPEKEPEVEGEIKPNEKPSQPEQPDKEDITTGFSTTGMLFSGVGLLGLGFLPLFQKRKSQD